MDKIMEELLKRLDARYPEPYDNLRHRECFGWDSRCAGQGIIHLPKSGMWLCQVCFPWVIQDVLGDVLQEYCELLDEGDLA